MIYWCTVNIKTRKIILEQNRDNVPLSLHQKIKKKLQIFSKWTLHTSFWSFDETIEIIMTRTGWKASFNDLLLCRKCLKSFKQYRDKLLHTDIWNILLLSNRTIDFLMKKKTRSIVYRGACVHIRMFNDILTVKFYIAEHWQPSENNNDWSTLLLTVERQILKKNRKMAAVKCCKLFIIYIKKMHVFKRKLYNNTLTIYVLFIRLVYVSLWYMYIVAGWLCGPKIITIGKFTRVLFRC